MGQDVEKLQELIDQHDRIVFFGGAGVSTESGIPDFRSVDGLYNQKYDYPPETILSHTFLCVILKNFTAFTGIRCWHWMQSRMRHITVGTGGGGKAYRCGDTEHRRTSSGSRK